MQTSSPYESDVKALIQNAQHDARSFKQLLAYLAETPLDTTSEVYQHLRFKFLMSYAPQASAKARRSVLAACYNSAVNTPETLARLSADIDSATHLMVLSVLDEDSLSRIPLPWLCHHIHGVMKKHGLVVEHAAGPGRPGKVVVTKLQELIGPALVCVERGALAPVGNEGKDYIDSEASESTSEDVTFAVDLLTLVAAALSENSHFAAKILSDAGHCATLSMRAAQANRAMFPTGSLFDIQLAAIAWLVSRAEGARLCTPDLVAWMLSSDHEDLRNAAMHQLSRASVQATPAHTPLATVATSNRGISVM